jgi:serine/threonine protein kinase
MADWTGRKIGRVQIKDLIARGGMAEIYLGEHESYGQVAVKVMRGLLERDPGQLARFQREAQVIGQLKHPNIVQWVDYILEDETPCLVMEYVPGPSLAAYMKALHDRRQRIPIAIVAQILRAVAAALDFAHSNGIVHRDIKPANVLLRSASQVVSLENSLPLDVEPVLTDFGLVRLVDSTMHTTTGSVSGTPAYMSPEQARGEKVDYRTDIYSLGVMLYEMLAGAVPFQSDTTFGMLMKHINETPPPIKGLSSDMYALLERALAKDPALRYESAGALANEFMALFNGQTISPGTLHMAEMARKIAEAGSNPKPQPPSRYRWVRLGIEAVLIIGLALLIFQYVRPTGTTPSATLDPNTPVGKAQFSYFNGDNDTVTFSLTGISPPEPNSHLEAWFVSDDQKYRDVGRIVFDASGIGLKFSDPGGKNLLDGLSEIQITKEPDGVSNSKPTGEVVYSSVFPPQALVPIRNLLVTYDKTPDNLPLIQGIWYYGAEYINYSINGYKDGGITSLMDAYKTSDEATIRKQTEEIINQIVGDQSNQYRDYDQDGKIDTIPIRDVAINGYGMFSNGNQNGYIQETLLQAKLAADASDSTPNIRENSQSLQICVQNLQSRLNLILQAALKLNDTPFGPEMESIITDLSALGNTLLPGEDADGNGRIEPIAGECGATDAYNDAGFLADMLLYPGPDRIPPP